MSRRKDGVKSNEMMAMILEVRYDFRKMEGFLHMVDGHCCDMTGAIQYFRKIDGMVETIFTFSGDRPDTVFLNLGSDPVAVVSGSEPGSFAIDRAGFESVNSNQLEQLERHFSSVWESD